MSEDGYLIGAVFVVWAALALLYALVPMFHMPGATTVWGAGALVFLALALAVGWSERRAGRR